MLKTHFYGKIDYLKSHNIVYTSEPETNGHTKMTAVWTSGKQTVTFEKMD
jgi:hypothetical protein